MTNVTVIGAQWGDEGKGKIIDWLSNRADMVVRFQGGNNAGHTIVVGDKTYKLSLLPSGVVQGKRSVIGDASSAEVSDLIAAADVIITDLGDGRSLADIASAATESAVVIAITPFGTHGPYVDQDLQVNEFILQALCGSIGGRGWWLRPSCSAQPCSRWPAVPPARKNGAE